MSEPTKVVILAGGLGTRLSEETDKIPKPMVEIGGRPILWHIMKHYAHFGFNEFFIALGYKGEAIKRYFLDYYTLSRNMTINLKTGDVAAHDHDSEDWTVHLIDTGQETNTGGRVKRLAPFLKDAPFMVTYGDGVTNADINQILAFHRSHGRLATITAVRPPSRFGGLSLSAGQVVEFIEKPQIGEGWISGGFMVFQPGILDYLQGDKASLEVTLLERLAVEGQLMAYEHSGFWQCMDTVRDVNTLRTLWESANPPWKVWAK